MTLTLLTGDCITLSKELKDNSIDCIVTSPPYNKGGKGKIGTGIFRNIVYDTFDDSLPEKEYQQQQIDLLNILFDKTKVGGSFFYNHKVRYLNGNAISPWEWLTKTKWNIREEIVWNRGSGTEISGARFMHIDERIYWLCKGDKRPRLNNKFAQYTSIWKFGPEMKNDHPAPFPLELPLRCIQSVVTSPGIILDPYSGSGTTGVAATLLEHDYIGFDLSDKYLKESKNRIENPPIRDLKKFSEVYYPDNTLDGFFT